VSRESLGRWGRAAGNKGSEVVMLRGSRGLNVGGIECDIVDSIMRTGDRVRLRRDGMDRDRGM
jgi:hypothetical protein